MIAFHMEDISKGDQKQIREILNHSGIVPFEGTSYELNNRDSVTDIMYNSEYPHELMIKYEDDIQDTVSQETGVYGEIDDTCYYQKIKDLVYTCMRTYESLADSPEELMELWNMVTPDIDNLVCYENERYELVASSQGVEAVTDNHLGELRVSILEKEFQGGK